MGGLIRLARALTTSTAVVRENPVVVVRSSPSHPLVIWLATVLALLASAAAVLLTHAREHFATGMLWMIGCATPTVLAVALFRHYRTANAAHEHALREMAARSQTVDRLLDFSQTIQGAGKPEQIFDSLALFLHTELSLSGVAIIAHDPDALPPTSLKSVFPATLNRSGCSLAEMDTAMCPCLRQNLPKCFKPDASPVRCSVDEALRLPPDHPAYCIPFTVGRKTQVMVHTLLPPNEQWTEDRRQLAQTYINTASSSLITLHHLSEAERQSMTDALTGLYNRRSMEQLLQRELALSERHGQALSLVMIDMDKFKEINDEHGHAAGDHMLRAFADCVRITLRKTDLAFRYGGDEFVIALPQTGVDQAKAVVQKLRQAYSAVDFSGAIAHLATQPTLSIGVAERSVRDNIITLPTLLAAADSALYEAKKADRNCIKIYSGPQAA